MKQIEGFLRSRKLLWIRNIFISSFITLCLVTMILITGCENDSNGVVSQEEEEFYLILPIPEGSSYEISAIFDSPQLIIPSPTASGLHEGIDYDIDSGTPIIASAPGTIIDASDLGGQREMRRVLIQHAKNFRTNYGHLDSYVVTIGQNVERGEIIGYSWTVPGCSGKPHIHFGLYKDSQAIDPQPYFRDAEEQQQYYRLCENY